MLACVLATPLPAATGAPPPAVALARAWRVQHERAILAEFTSLVALPNVASDAPGIARNVAALTTMLERRGVQVRVLHSGDAPPLIVGDLAAPAGARTLAFYAHYDGQPADTASWHGLPWTPVLRDPAGHTIAIGGDKPLDPESRLTARAVADDKAPIMAMLVALDALHAAHVQPKFHLRLVFEGEEEAGSPHLGDYLAQHANLLRPDAWVLCDGPVHQSGRRMLAYGARGTTSLELTVYGPNQGLHSGHYGNWAPNPIVRLTHLLDSMRDEDGRILIAHFGDDVLPPSAAERAALAAIPPVERDLEREFQLGSTEGGGAPLNELLMRPALNVRGIRSGNVGERASNTIQPSASASLDFRLVPAQTPQHVRELVERHITAQGYTIVRSEPDSATRVASAKLVRLEWGPGYAAARTPLEQPLAREIANLLTADGHELVRMPTLGGSIPMYLFQQPGTTPVIILPIVNHDDRQHAPDENLRLANLWDGIEIFAGLFAGLAR